MNDAWMFEFQLCLATPTSEIYLALNSDADHDWNPPERFLQIMISAATGNLFFVWDNRTTSGQVQILNCVKLNEFQHIAIQKSSGSQVIRVYLDGNLIITQALSSSYALSNIDFFRLLRREWRLGGQRVRREISGSLPYGRLHSRSHTKLCK